VLSIRRCATQKRSGLPKAFEHFAMLGNQIRIVSQRTTGLGRFLLVILTMVAWLSISNHCALATVTASGSKTLVAPMHCHGAPAPQSPAKSGDEQTPCCKLLKAITIAKVHVGANAVDFALKEYPTAGLVVEISQAPTQTFELDTGPTGARSFSESVLQRSILAHAPPLSLS
jgi:hypothetical protein